MALITGDQLKQIQKILGLPIAQVSGITDIDMGNVSLTMGISDIVRRGASIGTIDGWFLGVLQNVHSGADGERSEIDPYNPGADAVAPFPAVVPEGWDIWLLGASLIQITPSGTLLTAAQILLNPQPFSQGWGRDDTGSPVAATNGLTVARFTSVVNDVTDLGAEAGITDQGLPHQPIRMRVPRGSTISFSSESSAAATFRALLVCGLFPSALGQDGVT